MDKELSEQRNRYLHAELLVTTIKELAAEVLASPKAEEHPDYSLWDSIMTTLMVAESMQRLQLPFDDEDDTAAVADTGLAEAGDYALGITPHIMCQRWIPDLPLKQELHQRAIPRIKERIKAKADAVRHMLRSGQEGALTDEQLLLSLEALLSRRRALQAGRLSTQAAMMDVLQQQAERLRECSQLLAHIVHHHRLGLQRQHDLAAVKHYRAHLHSLEGKVRQFELQFQSHTYTAANVMALEKVEALLSERERSVTQETQELTILLASYRGLGEQFERIVDEYAQVKAQLERAHHALERFRELQEELDLDQHAHAHDAHDKEHSL